MLDAGCGGALSALALFEDVLARVRFVGVDISDAVDVAADRFSQRGLEAAFVQADLNRIPLPDGSVDVLFSEGVLHHTDSTRDALLATARLLAPGGRFLFYVYRRKGPIREFTDDHIREQLQEMSPQEAWDAVMPLTRLGRLLGDLEVEVDVPETIDLLEIPAGKIDLQRLFYWHVFKAFHHPELTLDELNHINFDWYAPRNAHRQSPEEVRGVVRRGRARDRARGRRGRGHHDRRAAGGVSDVGAGDLGDELRALHDALGAQMRREHDRDLPFEELVFDRWERARSLGFGEGASIYHNAYVFGDVTVGAGTWIGPFVMLDGSGGLEIGATCSISTGVHIYTHDTVRWALSGGDARARARAGADRRVHVHRRAGGRAEGRDDRRALRRRRGRARQPRRAAVLDRRRRAGAGARAGRDRRGDAARSSSSATGDDAPRPAGGVSNNSRLERCIRHTTCRRDGRDAHRARCRRRG